jgi:UDP-N-acetylmuramate--alanine ligase
MIVVDDYAHHPTAVRATIAAARQYHRGPILVAFQPHRYSRTAYLARDFADALRGADRVYLAPVYAASEAPIPGVSERSIGEPLGAAGGPHVTYVQRVDDLEERIFEEAPRNSLVLMLGAGNITDVAARLARRVDEAGVSV